jgi:transcriptional regulator with XRE-family HTH domain
LPVPFRKLIRRAMEQLVRLRELKGYSQRALAKVSGVSPATIYELENGRRRPNPSTLRKLAQGLEVEVADLLGEGWRQAFSNSLLFRTDAKERLRERLELWEAARDEEASDETRRRLLDQVGLVLDEAGEVLSKLLANLNDGLNHMAEPSPEGTPNAYWSEVQKADTLYRDLLAMVEGAGLSVRSKTPSDTARARQHELEALTA